MLDDPAQNAQPDTLDDASLRDMPNELPPEDPSLAEDISALLEDGRTYVEAELAFQKTRARFVGDKAKAGIVYGVAALAFLHLALVGLVVGLVFALAPYLTAFGATAAVVVVLLLGCVIFGKMAAAKFGRIGEAFTGDER